MTESAANTAPITNTVPATAQEAGDVPPGGPGKEFSTAIAEAEQIVLYTVRHGIEVPSSVLKEVVGARKKGPPERLSEDDQIKLWQSAQALAKLVQPVTINSIKATGSTGATIAWSIFSILLLVCLVATQIGWVLGQNVTTNIENISKTLDDANTDLKANELLRGLREDEVKRIYQEDERRRESSTPNDLQPGAKGNERSEAEKSTLTEYSRLVTAVTKSKDIIQQKERELTAAFEILDNWAKSVRVAYAGHDVEEAKTPSSEAPSQPSSFAEFERARQAAEAREEAKQVRRQILLGSVKATLKAMSGYLMPLLYGLLGAAAYVMRSLSKEISEVTFSNVSNVRFMLRLVLGMLSGISVGLILTPDTLPTTLSAVTPLALAFLAGYSVELLFLAMDRLISAFSSEGTRSAVK